MIKKLCSSIREYKKESIIAPIFVICEVGLEVIIPFLMANIIDIGIENKELNYIVKMGIVLVIAAILSLIFGMLSGRFAAKASSGFAKNLRKDMFYHIQNYSFTNLDKYSNASLITRLTTDVTNVQNAYQMIIRMLVRSPIMIICALFMAFTINASLAWIFLVMIPVLGFALYYIITKAHPHFEKVFRKYDDLNRVVQEDINGIRVVKAYAREKHEEAKFDQVNSQVFEFFKKAEKIVAFNSPIMQLTIYTCVLIISWLGAKMIVSNTMSTGQLTSLITYAWQILSSLSILSMVFVMVIISKSSAERIVEVLEEESTLKGKENGVQTVKDGSISFEHVNFSYLDENDKLALEDISITIKPGETIGVIGGTGSAKSSFVQLIPRLYDVTEGCVKVGGIDVREYDLDCLREEVSMVLQKNVLFSGTISENLRWGNKEATDEELVRVCQLAQADGFISEFPEKYETVLDQGGTNVSGGQKQRICIARALLKRPKILILDDSTSAIDTKTDAFIRKAFKEEIPNTTKIIIAQRISSIEDADKIIVLEDGKINGVGTSEELLKTNKIYQEVYESQMKGEEDEECTK